MNSDNVNSNNIGNRSFKSLTKVRFVETVI